MIADASVLIEYLRVGRAPSADVIDTELKAGRAVHLLPVILQEVLQGARDPAAFARWQRVLGTFPVMETDKPRDTAVAAAELYARCRWSGVTPRSGNDCLIAVSCIELGQSLLQRDRDFERVAALAPRLRLLPA